jgi:hypothetical protein
MPIALWHCRQRQYDNVLRKTFLSPDGVDPVNLFFGRWLPALAGVILCTKHLHDLLFFSKKLRETPPLSCFNYSILIISHL